MKKDKDPIDRLEEVLIQAYHEQQSPEPPSGWRQDVMREIRRLQDEPQRPDRSFVFRRMVLPFASAAAVAAILLAVYSFAFVPGFEHDLFAVLAEDPSGLLSTQLLGI